MYQAAQNHAAQLAKLFDKPDPDNPQWINEVSSHIRELIWFCLLRRL